MNAVPVRLALLALAATLAACGGDGNVSLSARAGAVVTSSRGSLAADQQNLVVGAVTITRIRVVLREVKLDNPGTGKNVSFKTEPMVLDLANDALEGTAHTMVTASVPEGTYTRVKFKIHKPNRNESADPEVLAMANADASVIVDGSIGGASFSFVTDVEAQQDLEGSFVIGGEGDNVTLNVDPTTWFAGSGSVTLDPRDAQNRSVIEGRIKASIKAFEDDDRNGRRD